MDRKMHCVCLADSNCLCNSSVSKILPLSSWMERNPLPKNKNICDCYIVWPWKYCGRPIIASGRRFCRPYGRRAKCDLDLNNPLEEVQSFKLHSVSLSAMIFLGQTTYPSWPPKPAANWASSVVQSPSLAHLNSCLPTCPSSVAWCSTAFLCGLASQPRALFSLTPWKARPSRS